jgi:hypothetical protein
MAIDDRLDVAKKLQQEDDSYLPVDLTVLAGELVLPGFVTAVLKGAMGRLGRKAQGERYRETTLLLIDELKDLRNLAATKQELRDVEEALQLMFRHDVFEFNDKKRGRYIKIIGNALKSEAPIEDLASFIQDVEQLGERDFLALGILNRVMNKAGDWGAPTNDRLHPNTFIHRRQEMAEQIARAFGIKTESGSSAQQFSQEEGYEACARLQGFGLAHEIDIAPRQVPIGDYCFRPSKRGLLLLKLAGEVVENWDRYFPKPGTVR